MLKDYNLRKDILKRLLNMPLTEQELQEEFKVDIKTSLTHLKEKGNAYMDKAGKINPKVISFHDYVKDNFPELFPMIRKSIYGDSLRKVGKEYNLSPEAIRTKEAIAIKSLEYGDIIFTDNFYEDSIPYMMIHGSIIELAAEHGLTEFLSANFYLKFFIKQDERAFFPYGAKQNFFDMPKELQELIKLSGHYITELGTIASNYDHKIVVEILKNHGPLTDEELLEIEKEGKFMYFVPKIKDREIKYYSYTMTRNKNIIRVDSKGLFRYYDYKKYEKRFPAIIEKVKKELSKYRGKVHIYYIYRTLEKDLKSIGIYNKFELHSFLRNFEIENLQMKRIPYIYVN